MRTVIDGAAQYERSLIRARTSAALQAKRARGERVSARIPFGFTVADDGVHLLPVPGEQAIIRKARALRGTGLSFDRVSAALAAEGLVSRSGRPFQSVQIQRMLSMS
jgi:DNA invertase Pin-like site-specific DNA recombinase